MSEQQRSPSGDNNNSNQNDAANHRLGASDSSVSSFRWDYNVPQSASDDPMLESRLVCMVGFSVRYNNRPAKQFFVVVEDVPENWNEFSVRSVIEAVAYQQLFSYDGPCQCGATSIVCNCCEAMWVNRIQNGLVSCSFADSKLGQDLNLVPKASVETSELHSH